MSAVCQRAESIPLTDIPGLVILPVVLITVWKDVVRVGDVHSTSTVSIMAVILELRTFTITGEVMVEKWQLNGLYDQSSIFWYASPSSIV